MRLLLIQFCTVLSLGAFSQKIAPNNKVLIENFPAASTYSIQMRFTDGEITSLGSSKIYIAAMFPQLDKLKVVKDSGNVIVTVTAGEEISLAGIRKRPEFSKMLANYQGIQPLPASAPAGKIAYFQPLTITFQTNGSVFYTMMSIGKLLQRDADPNRSTTGRNSRERTDALSSLEFLRAHLFDLQGNPD